MVMQKDVVIVYEPDAGQIGKNAFSDPLFRPYLDLIAIARNISHERVGNGTYSFVDPKGVNVLRKLSGLRSVSGVMNGVSFLFGSGAQELIKSREQESSFHYRSDDARYPASCRLPINSGTF